MVFATLTMLKTSFPTRLSENLTVVENDKIDDGGVAGGKRMNSRSTHLEALGELFNQIIRT